MPIKTEIEDSEQVPSEPPRPSSTNRGVVLPVARIYKQMKESLPEYLVTTGAALQTAIGLEDLVRLVLQEAAKNALEGRSDEDYGATIKPRHILFNSKLKVNAEAYLNIS